MKFFTACVISLVFALQTGFSIESTNQTKQLYVKFKPGYVPNGQIFSNQSVQETFGKMLGKFDYQTMLCNQTLQALKNKYSPKHSNSTMSVGSTPYDNLRRIYVVTYNSTIDESVASAKLSKLPEIEYAEPVYKRYLFSEPSDSLVSEQYHLGIIKAFEAWDKITTDRTVVVGIVDTGVDYLHEDLADNIWSNPGETGLDSLGRDKKTNGVDDDGNGYIDDWRGWDYASSSTITNGMDNDPMPGNLHGTHVAGIVAAVINNQKGGCGVAKNVKLLPVKCGDDSPFANSIVRGFDGILYAAMTGADVINCSWGGSGKSQAEQEIVNTAIAQGATIVCAAGNDNSETIFYPSGYFGIMSVVSTDSKDKKSSFSNYHKTDDVSAPGTEIMSTIPGNSYEKLSGTSMASPVAAGVAALVRVQYPDLTPLQVVEHVKATADNIDSINYQAYARKLGKGRVNVLKAVTSSIAKSVIMKEYAVIDPNNDGRLDKGETVKVNATFKNILANLKQVKVELTSVSEYAPTFINKEYAFGDMNTNDEKSVDSSLSFVIPGNIPVDYKLELEFKISDESGYIGSEYFDVIVRPSYQTMDGNNISVTFNSKGNIGYNDYPANAQGIGLVYKKKSEILFEGALMVGTNATKVSNVARSYNQGKQEASFTSNEVFTVTSPGFKANEDGYSVFRDKHDQLIDVGMDIVQKVYQFNDKGTEDFVIINYEMTNTSGLNYDSIFVSLFFDWDIGPSGRNNQSDFDDADSLGYTHMVTDSTYPWAGVILLSGQPLNYFALDNDGTTEDNPGIYDGFDRMEKWFTMSRGISRRQSSVTDASMVIGAGPINFKNGESKRVSFALIVGNDLPALKESAKKAREVSNRVSVDDMTTGPNDMFFISPLPAFEKLNILKNKNIEGLIKIEIYDALGNNVYDIEDFKLQEIDISKLYSGLYFVRMTNNGNYSIKPFTKIK